MVERRKMGARTRGIVEYGPLLTFFFTYYAIKLGAKLPEPEPIMYATGAILITTVLALGVSWFIERKIALMPLVSGILITIFGGTALILQDPIYLILKTTIYYLLVASALGVGLVKDRPLIKYVFKAAFVLPHDAWRILTWRWFGFFLFMGTLNVTIYFSLGLDFWVNFKVIGTVALFLIFSLAQTPFIVKNQIEPETTD